jgi:hypothetical protein
MSLLNRRAARASMLALLWSVCAVSAAVQAAPTALASPAMPAYAAFYVPGLADVFEAEAAMSRLMRACVEKFAGRCGSASDATLKSAAEERTQLRTISVFPIDLDTTPAKKSTTPEQYADAIHELRNAYTRKYFFYELDVLARYGATADVCPVKNQSEAVAAVLAFDLTHFWRVPASDMEQARATVANKRRQYGDEIRRNFPGKACVEARRFGDLQVNFIRDRLEPYKRDPQKKSPELMSDLYGEVLDSAWKMLATLELEAGNPKFESLLEDEVVRARCRRVSMCGKAANQP